MDTNEMFKKATRKFQEESKKLTAKQNEFKELDKKRQNFEESPWFEIFSALIIVFFVSWSFGTIYLLITGWDHYLYTRKCMPFIFFEMVFLVFKIIGFSILYFKYYKKIFKNIEEQSEILDDIELAQAYALLANANNILAFVLGYKGTNNFTEENQKYFIKEMEDTHKALKQYLGE